MTDRLPSEANSVSEHRWLAEGVGRHLLRLSIARKIMTLLVDEDCPRCGERVPRLLLDEHRCGASSRSSAETRVMQSRG